LAKLQVGGKLGSYARLKEATLAFDNFAEDSIVRRIFIDSFGGDDYHADMARK
jgi:hypothetical protein